METFMMMMIMMMVMMMTAIIVMTRGREECGHLPMSRTWRKISVARLSWRVEQTPYPMSKSMGMDRHRHDGRLVSRN